VIASHSPALLQPLCRLIPVFFRAHLDMLAMRGTRTHAHHASASDPCIVHSIPTSSQQLPDPTENSQAPPVSEAQNVPKGCMHGDVDVTGDVVMRDEITEVEQGHKRSAGVAMHDTPGMHQQTTCLPICNPSAMKCIYLQSLACVQLARCTLKETFAT
jgi:hypothetical protein